MSEYPMTNSISEANREVARLSRDLDITNADHIALWIEANTIPDEPMSQCASWLACRIVEAHEAAMSRASQPVDTGVVLCVHGKPYPCERQSDWGCKPADCIPLDSEAVERVREAAEALLVTLATTAMTEAACVYLMSPAMKLKSALTALKEDDRG